MPSKVSKSFAESAKFAVKLINIFPDEYQLILDLRLELKLHHFDLADTIENTKLLASSTIRNTKRVTKKLKLRTKMKDKGKLTPRNELHIWKD